MITAIALSVSALLQVIGLTVVGLATLWAASAGPAPEPAGVSPDVWRPGAPEQNLNISLPGHAAYQLPVSASHWPAAVVGPAVPRPAQVSAASTTATATAAATATDAALRQRLRQGGPAQRLSVHSATGRAHR